MRKIWGILFVAMAICMFLGGVPLTTSFPSRNQSTFNNDYFSFESPCRIFAGLSGDLLARGKIE